MERWPSGLRRTLGKRVYVNRVPWVRIPLSPPNRQFCCLPGKPAPARQTSMNEAESQLKLRGGESAAGAVLGLAVTYMRRSARREAVIVTGLPLELSGVRPALCEIGHDAHVAEGRPGGRIGLWSPSPPLLRVKVLSARTSGASRASAPKHRARDRPRGARRVSDRTEAPTPRHVHRPVP